MSLTVVAAGSALALYLASRRSWAQGGLCDGTAAVETHANVHFAPNSFMEDLYFLAEGLRYTYSETLGRWRTADLLIGLAYLARKDPEEHPVADIAMQGRPFGQDLAAEEWPAALAWLHELERFFRYCSGLRERRPLQQRQYFATVLGIGDDDLLVQELRAGVLKPSYVLCRDAQLQAIVLAIRGTHSFKDALSSLTGASKPHHLVDANGVVLGYSHFGMLAAARWIKSQVKPQLEAALAANPGYRLKIIGHSLGGGTAAIVTMMLREQGGPFAEATCVAVACPSCMTLELAQSCSEYVTTVVHGADVVPTICPATADALRESISQSSWFQEFKADVRNSSAIVRAVESGIRGVGSATLSATSWTTSKLAACYQRGSFSRPSIGRRRQLKRRNSDEDLLAAASDAEASPAQGEGDDGLPLSSSAPAGSGMDLAAAAAGDRGPGGGEAGASWQAQQLRRVTRQITGQGAAMLSSTSQVLSCTGQLAASGTTSVLRSTSGLLRRIWPSSGAVAGDGSEAAVGEAAGGGGSPPAAATEAAAPGPMDIEEDDEDEEAAAMLLDELEGEEGGGGRASVSYEEQRHMRVQLEMEASLEEEVSLRMHEVQQAVHDAEEEEEATGQDDSTVPAVIRPGGYGASAAANVSPSKRDARWRRQFFPAGRIMHLVPARLVPGTAAHAAAAAAATGMAGVPPSSPSAAGGEGAEEGAAQEAAAGAAAQPAQSSSAAEGGAGAPSRGTHSHQLSVSDLVAGEGLEGPRSPYFGAEGAAAAGGEDGSSAGVREQQVAQAQQVQQEEMLLLDHVPQQAYSRIKLCRTMLREHVIPRYLPALESAIAGMCAQAGIDTSAPEAADVAAGSGTAAAPATVAALAAASCGTPLRQAAGQSSKQD